MLLFAGKINMGLFYISNKNLNLKQSYRGKKVQTAAEPSTSDFLAAGFIIYLLQNFNMPWKPKKITFQKNPYALDHLQCSATALNNLM